MYDVMGQQHVLKYALDFIGKWGDDPTFTDPAQRKREVERATLAIAEWHKKLVHAGKLGATALMKTPALEWLAERDRRVAERAEALRAGLERAAEDLRFAGSMLDAICRTDSSHDRTKARDAAYEAARAAFVLLNKEKP
jgi:hypothetical protein